MLSAYAAEFAAEIGAASSSWTEVVAAWDANRQIAEELFISAKTVSAHVSRILAKFGAASRGEAAAAAHRLHLFDSG